MRKANIGQRYTEATGKDKFSPEKVKMTLETEENFKIGVQIPRQT